MANDTFDKILTSTPLNSTAGRVTSRGTHYEPQMKEAPHIQHWSAPPPMKPLPNTPSCIDLRGRKFGRLTVIGLADIPQTSAGVGRWVVRCACGDYEHRTGKAIKNPKNNEDRCRICADLMRKRRRYEMLGSRPIEYFKNG